MAKHVFVETNWVVDYAGSSLSRNAGALELLEQARNGDFVLHLPAICLVEARRVISRKSGPKDLAAIRRYIRPARGAGTAPAAAAEATLKVLARFESFADQEKRDAPVRVQALGSDTAIRVFPLSQEALTLSVEISTSPGIDLESFDLAIMAAVAAEARSVTSAGDAVSFCTLDGDLQPWGRSGQPKAALKAIYDREKIWVYGDFLLETPARPADFG